MNCGCGKTRRLHNMRVGKPPSVVVSAAPGAGKKVMPIHTATSWARENTGSDVASEPVDVVVVGNRPYTKDTPLGFIFKKIAPKWQHVRAGDVYARRQQDNSLLGYVLMACVEEQVNFLAAIWDQFHFDEDIRTAFLAIVKRGRLLDVLDNESKDARERVALVYAGVMEAWGKM